MHKNNENTNAFLIHISAFTGYLFPLANILVPLILWQTQKDKSEFLDNHGKEAVNFNISYSLYQLVFGFSLFTSIFQFFRNTLWNHNSINFSDTSSFLFDGNWIFGPITFISLIGLFKIIKGVLIVIAAMKAQKGETYKYPLTIKFIK